MNTCDEKNKHTEIALTAIYGIGRGIAKKICIAAGVEATSKLKDLNESDVEKLLQNYKSLK